MTYNKAIHNRQSIRLQEYNYSQSGIYFVTINSKDRNNIPDFFGKIVDGAMLLNDLGKIVEEVWQEIPDHFKGVELDTFVIMPDHMHGLIIINEIEELSHNPGNLIYQNRGVVSQERALKKRSLGSIVGSFKAEVSRRIIRKLKTERASIWQRNFYERIIRDDKELETVRCYIENNPANWGRK